jgi:hypothetical protein
MLFIVLGTWIEPLSMYSLYYCNSNIIISLIHYTLCHFRFYTECLGMKLLRKRDIPEEKYTNAFLGYGPEDSHFVIELTYSKTRLRYVFQ